MKFITIYLLKNDMLNKKKVYICIYEELVCLISNTYIYLFQILKKFP